MRFFPAYEAENARNMKKVMVFGTFDGAHEGHRAFLKEARGFGDYLMAVVSQDHIVEHLKGRLPKLNLAARFSALEKEDNVDEVVAGDAHLSAWEIVKKLKPDIIAVGYDQSALKSDLKNNLDKIGYAPEIKVMNSYKPDIYHSSKL